MWILVGAVAAVLSTSAFIPQVLKMYRTKSVSDLSPIMLTQSLVSILCWSAYGFHLKDPVIIAANAVSTAVMAIAVLLFVRYRPRKAAAQANVSTPVAVVAVVTGKAAALQS